MNKYLKSVCRLLVSFLPVLILLFPAVPVGAETTYPELTAVPAEGKVGEWIAVKGSGFKAKTLLKFYFSNNAGDTSDSIDSGITAYKAVGTVYTTSSGVVDNKINPPGNQISFQIPSRVTDGTRDEDVEVGTHFIYATYFGEKRVIAYARFEVTTLATMTTAPEDGFVGDTVAINAEKLGGFDKITVQFDNIDVAISSNWDKSDDNGNFNGTVSVPELSNGKHTITVKDETGNSLTGNFTVGSKIDISPETQSIGGTVTVSGTGFSPRDPVLVSLNGREMTPKEAPVSSSFYGSFKATFAVPFDFSYQQGGKVKISASTGTAVAEKDLSVTATGPTLEITPATSVEIPGYVGMPVTLNGMWFEKGDSVNILIDNATTPVATLTVGENTAFLTDFNLPALKGGEHALRAVSAGTDVSLPLFIESDPPSIPVQESPQSASVSSAAPTLSWKSVSDPSGVTYDIQVAADRGFSDILITKQGITGAQYEFSEFESMTLSQKNEPIYWRLRAVDGAANASPWTPAATFFIGSSWSSIPPWAIYALAGLGVLLLVVIFFYLKRRMDFGKR